MKLLKKIMKEKKQIRNISNVFEHVRFRYVDNIRGTFIFRSFETP
jgi:hypothetical protein